MVRLMDLWPIGTAHPAGAQRCTLSTDVFSKPARSNIGIRAGTAIVLDNADNSSLFHNEDLVAGINRLMNAVCNNHD